MLIYRLVCVFVRKRQVFIAMSLVYNGPLDIFCCLKCSVLAVNSHIFKLIVGTLQVYLLDTYLEIDAEFYNFSKIFRKQQLACFQTSRNGDNVCTF